jgi:hypothetical protein
LKIARDSPLLLGFAIYVRTVRAHFVQILLAFSATGVTGRVERLQPMARA